MHTAERATKYNQPKTQKIVAMKAENLTMRIGTVVTGLTRALPDAPSLSTMHGADWVSLHITPLSLIRLVQQDSCQQNNQERKWHADVRLVDVSGGTWHEYLSYAGQSNDDITWMRPPLPTLSFLLPTEPCCGRSRYFRTYTKLSARALQTRGGYEFFSGMY